MHTFKPRTALLGRNTTVGFVGSIIAETGLTYYGEPVPQASTSVLMRAPGSIADMAYPGTNGAPPPTFGTLVTDRRDEAGTLFRMNRSYDPLTGRFTQEDPIGFGGGLNLYSYAGGDPINFSDPWGLNPCQTSKLVAMITSDAGGRGGPGCWWPDGGSQGNGGKSTPQNDGWKGGAGGGGGTPSSGWSSRPSACAFLTGVFALDVVVTYMGARAATGVVKATPGLVKALARGFGEMIMDQTGRSALMAARAGNTAQASDYLKALFAGTVWTKAANSGSDNLWDAIALIIPGVAIGRDIQRLSDAGCIPGVEP